MDEKETAAKLRRLEAENQKLKEANIGLAKRNQNLEEELRDSDEERKELKETINRAKDIRPWQRPNFRNVKQMAKRAFLTIEKVAGGWIVKMGSRIGKKFKTLRDIWLILTREDWNLHEEFLPYEEQPAVVAVEQPTPITSSPIPNPQHPTPNSLSDDTPIGNWGTLGKLKSEWRNFPNSRNAIAELFARQGLDLALLTGAT